jgi:hypothetical protein
MPNQNATTEKSPQPVPPGVFPSSTSGEYGARISDASHATERESAASPTTYEFVDCRELAHRLTVPVSWIRDRVRARAEDPLPHVNFGKYVRFLWGSPALELWIARRIVMGNNRRLGRTQRKEK